MHTYSPFFETLYDEQDAVGVLGRGTHYSVLRAIVFHDQTGSPLTGTLHKNASAQFHDFAVIWDEDHDTRVIEAIEKIYAAGLLPLFPFIGERKAILTGLAFADSKNLRSFAATQIEEICKDINNDCWVSEVGVFNEPNGIISSSHEKVLLYLSNINMLWNLGLKEITHNKKPT